MNYLRAKAVAEKLDMSVSSVWRLVAQGVLPKPTKLTPRTTLFSETDIDEAIEKIASVKEEATV